MFVEEMIRKINDRAPCRNVDIQLQPTIASPNDHFFAWKFPCHLRNGLLLVKKKDKWRWRAYIPGLLLSLLSIHMILLLAQLCVLYEKGQKTRGSTILCCHTL